MNESPSDGVHLTTAYPIDLLLNTFVILFKKSKQKIKILS